MKALRKNSRKYKDNLAGINSCRIGKTSFEHRQAHRNGGRIGHNEIGSPGINSARQYRRRMEKNRIGRERPAVEGGGLEKSGWGTGKRKKSIEERYISNKVKGKAKRGQQSPCAGVWGKMADGGKQSQRGNTKERFTVHQKKGRKKIGVMRK